MNLRIQKYAFQILKRKHINTLFIFSWICRFVLKIVFIDINEINLFQ